MGSGPSATPLSPPGEGCEARCLGSRRSSTGCRRLSGWRVRRHRVRPGVWVQGCSRASLSWRLVLPLGVGSLRRSCFRGREHSSRVSSPDPLRLKGNWVLKEASPEVDGSARGHRFCRILLDGLPVCPRGLACHPGWSSPGRHSVLACVLSLFPVSAVYRGFHGWAGLRSPLRRWSEV